MLEREELRRRPFLAAAVPLAAGVALSDLVPGSGLLWPAIAAVSLALVAVRRYRIAGWILVGFLAGFARAEWSQDRPPDNVRHLEQASSVRVTGRVLAAPRHFSPATGSFPLDIDSVEIDGRPAPWTGRVLVRFYETPPALRGGETVLLEGRLGPLRPPSNPGVFDRAAAMDRDGFSATVSTSRPIEVLKEGSWFRPAAWTDGARAGLRSLLARHAPPEVAAFQSALLFGSREDLPADFTTALQRSGTAHFLAVSGFNLVLVLVVAWYVLLVCGMRGPTVPAILLGVLLIYTALTGWQVSVVRAFLMSAAVLGARLVWRRSDVVNSLSLAALAILLWDPAQLFDTGFQLSFVAVLGIVAIGPIYHEYLAPPPGPPGSPLLGWLGHQARGALGVTIGAWLATAPIVLSTFHLVTPVILGANLLLCPLVTIQSFLALAAIPLAVFCPPAAGVTGVLASWIFDATLWGSVSMTNLPAAYLFLPALPAWAVAGYYAALGAWIWRARARPGRLKPWMCVAFSAALALTPLGFRSPVHPVFGLIDVGRGSSAYLRTAEGGTIVFDCGSLSYRDPGDLVAAPVLWSRGVSRAHTLVLSHADADHVNGAASVVERLGVRRLVVPRGFDHEIVAFARKHGVEVVQAVRGDVVPGLEILGPPAGSEAWPANERSLVVRVSTPFGRILIPGDIEEIGTRALLDSGADLRAEILLLPHHGKRQDLHRELVAAVAPKVILVSAPDGYASQEVLDHARASAVVYQTGLDGWIEVDLAPSGLAARRFRGE